MADETTTSTPDTAASPVTKPPGGHTGQSLLASVQGELKKQKADAFKNELKELVKQRDEAQKTLDLVNDKITKKIEDFDSGLV